MKIQYEIIADESFQGPLEELLDAARSQEVPLRELNLTELIEDFASHVANRINTSVSSVSEYLLVFSELIRIKTRLLIPDEEESNEKKEVDPDANSQSFFDKAADRLKKEAQNRAKLLENDSDEIPSEVKKGETDFREVTLFELIRSFQKVMSTVRETQSPDIEITNEFNTEEQMKFILERTESESMLAFEQLLRPKPTREEIIVTFLSILQLVKQGDLRLVKAEQEGTIKIVNGNQSDN